MTNPYAINFIRDYTMALTFKKQVTKNKLRDELNRRISSLNLNKRKIKVEA